MSKAESIWAIVLGVGLIWFSVYVINSYSKDPSKSTFTKIVVDILAVIFILGAIIGIWRAGKSLAA